MAKRRRKKTSFRTLSRLLLFLAVLLVIGAVALNFFADGAVRMGVQKAGTKALKVDVGVAAARLSITGGSLNLRDIAVANPAGYDSSNLLTLSRGDIQIETKSLLGQAVRIRDVQLDGMHVVIEQKGLGNNLYDVLKTLRRNETASGKRLTIDNLEIKNITVDFMVPPAPGQGERVPLKVAPIKMTNLGRNERLDVATLTSRILLAVAAGIATQGGDVLPEDMLWELGTILDKAMDIGRVIFGNGDESGGGIAEGIEDLLGSKKKE